LKIVWLGDDGSDDPARVGGKTAGLAPHARRHPVPPAFCLPVGSRATGADIAAAYAALGERAGQAEPAVAVRSSAVDEDGSGASFAGVYETFLNVTGGAAVAEAVEHCRASAADPRVAEYRRQRGVEGGAAVAVLVQQLVTADASAVVFTADPVSKDRERVVINAAWGLGEALVSGIVNPDTYLVAKAGSGRPGDILERRPARKEKMTVPVPGGTSTVGVPRALTSVPCLDDDAVLAAAALALELEDTLGHACDVECAWAGGNLYLLQCRPITTL
jgi:pyruvate,water dikinase